MASQFDARTGQAREAYAQGLADALYGPWIEDPSYALTSDEEVYEKIMRDPVAAHSIRYRKHLVAGQEWRVLPASEADADQRAATLFEEILDQVEGFDDARIRLASAIFKGSAYQFVEGTRRWTVLDGIPGSWWVPTRLIDVDRRRFRLANDGWRFWSAVRRAWEPLEHPEWFVRSVFDDVESSLGYGRGLLDTLYRYQALKARTLQKAGSAVDRFAEGFLVAKVQGARDGKTGMKGPDRTTAQVAAKFIELLKRQRADNFMVIDAEDDLTMVNGVGEGWGMIEAMLGYLDTNQVMAVLGSTLATMQSLNEVGSNAKAKEHATSTEALVQADRRRLSDDLTRDLLGLIWNLNRYQIEAVAPGARKPKFTLVQQQKEDPEAAAKVVQILLTSGVKLRSDEVYERTGFTPPGMGDEVIEPQPAPAAPPGGGFGDFGGFAVGARRGA